MNKLEKQMQENITLNEGLLASIAKLFIRGKVKRQYKKAYDIAKDDPKLQAALADMENYHERLNDIIKSLCKRNADHPKCK
jgi:adenylosuccinate lyase